MRRRVLDLAPLPCHVACPDQLHRQRKPELAGSFGAHPGGWQLTVREWRAK